MDLRQVVERRCDSKRYFKRISIAEKVAAKLSSRGGGLSIAYKCIDCDGYHVGHADISQQIAHKQRKPMPDWKTKKKLAMKVVCPRCLAEIDKPCVQATTPVKGYTIMAERRTTHKERYDLCVMKQRKLTSVESS